MAGERNKWDVTRKKEVKLFLFVDVVILYIEGQNSTRRLLESVCKFSKAQYKTLQHSFTSAMNLPGKKLMEIIPFMVAPKRRNTYYST